MTPFAGLTLLTFGFFGVGSAETKAPALPTNFGAADSVVRVYDLRPATPIFDEDDNWSQRLLMAPSDGSNDVESVNPARLYDEASTDIIVDLIGQVFGDELRYEGREISLTNDSKLVVLAPEAVHTRVSDLLAMLERILAGGIQLTVDVIELPDGADTPQGGIIEAAEAERLLAGLQRDGAAHASYETRLRAGRTTALDLTRQSAFLQDYDVEIATGATVFDPVIGLVEEGMRLLLRGVPTPDGLFLTVIYQDADLIGDSPLETLPVDGTVWNEQGSIHVYEELQVQEVSSFQRGIAFDTFLPTGKAILAYSEYKTAKHTSRQVMLVRRRGGDLSSFHDLGVTGTTRRLLAVNTELFSPPSLSIGGPWVEDAGHDSRHDVLTYVSLSAEPSLFFFDWIKHRFSVWRRMGPWAIAVTDPSWDDRAAQELGSLVQKWKPETDVTHADVRLHRSQGGDLPVRWSVPVRAGSACAARIGMVSLATTDYDVEVAQGAGVRDPVRCVVFDGLAAGLTAARGGSRALSLDVSAIGHLFEGGVKRLETASPSANIFDQPSFDQIVVKERLNLVDQEGEAVRVRLGDTGQGGKGLQLEIILR